MGQSLRREQRSRLHAEMRAAFLTVLAILVSVRDCKPRADRAVYNSYTTQYTTQDYRPSRGDMPSQAEESRSEIEMAAEVIENSFNETYHALDRRE